MGRAVLFWVGTIGDCSVVAVSGMRGNRNVECAVLATKSKKIVLRFSTKTFAKAKIKRIPTGIHKTFAGAKIKLASAKLTNKTKVLLHRTAVQWYLPSASGIAPWAVVCLCIAQTLL